MVHEDRLNLGVYTFKLRKLSFLNLMENCCHNLIMVD